MNHNPVIAIIGRQNVGKSTLFNCFTRTQDALVADFPGMTRDRKYGSIKVEGNECIIVDTGGIEEKKYGIFVETHIAYQSILAIQESDIILFVVDARAELMQLDFSIAKNIHRYQKSIFLVANKIDGINTDIALGNFFSIGLGKIYPISASHNLGIKQLLKKILISFFLEKAGKKMERKKFNEAVCAKKKSTFTKNEKNIHLAIVGRQNVGKSTIINCIMSEERMVVYDKPGTTRDSIYIPIIRKERNYVLIDTAGVRKQSKITKIVEKCSIIKTLQAIEYSKVVLLVINACEEISYQDYSLLRFIINSGRALVIAINKWDRLSESNRKYVKKMFVISLRFVKFARIHFISALHGHGIGNLFNSIEEAYACATFRVNTSLLTKIMKRAVEDHPPPLVNGKRVKLKYAHAGGYNPPIIVIHCNNMNNISDSYKRYLRNYFIRSLKFIGTLINIHICVHSE